MLSLLLQEPHRVCADDMRSPLYRNPCSIASRCTSCGSSHFADLRNASHSAGDIVAMEALRSAMRLRVVAIHPLRLSAKAIASRCEHSSG